MARLQTIALDRARIVAAAFAQLEETGLDGLSMRPLASRLGVQAPALYWHVPDKSALLRMMAKEIYAGAYAAIPASLGWRDWLIELGRALRRTFVAHRDGARLCATVSAPDVASPDERARGISAPLVALGLDMPHALSFQASVISFALGWSSFEANGSMHAYLAAMMDFDASFETGLQALVKGFEPA
ncbi:TetR family transcriptional regulator [Sphingobium sp. B11D3D]|uniref:TetR family transcriptional regulator n=1 Tax=Sphingobium sp. B11D3D TaxID=2940576 RepID=UPI0022256BFE|nr:TetR/AcrR family transcriptional regulator C-terminal domain-containing protein [Sphingobium sp. B11D3D]MCW2370092.1 TetR/AcrR family tetracycline transcriptional repressor [Sphingobium sp. B11D3D]